jgi:hypothetical protein
MKRCIFALIATASFALGLGIGRVGNVIRERLPRVMRPTPILRESAPVRVRIPPIMETANSKVPYDHYYAIVENMSVEPVSRYVVGFGTQASNVAAPGFMPGTGITYTYPDSEPQPLIPGETRMIPIKATAIFSEEAVAWIDYVEFTDGSTWGENKSGTKVAVR